MTEREKDLETQLETAIGERDQFHAELIDLKIEALRKRVDDHEERMRDLEKIAVRSNVLYALATGGGLVSIVMLFKTLLAIP